jgi:hypothetical protein
MRTLLAACSLLVAATLAPAPALAQADEPAASVVSPLEIYQDAVAAFREQRYSAAYGRFMRLADAGHEASAQMALMMYRHGPTLFSAEWEATDFQLARWSEIVIAVERDNREQLRVSAR